MMLQSTIRMGATFLALALMLCTPMLAPAVQAQEGSVDLSADLTDAEFQAMLGRLSDEQVRDILIAEFAERRIEESAQGAGLLTNSRDIGETLTTNAAAVFAKLPELGAGIGAVFTRRSDAGGVGLAFVALAISLLAGGIVRYYWRKRGEARQISIGERNIGKGAYGSVSTIVDAIFVLLIALSGSAAFALTAMAVLYLFFHHPDIRFFVSSYVAVVTVV